MLVVTQPSRLPATILSRCQRMRVRAPARAEASPGSPPPRGRGRLECGAGCARRGAAHAPCASDPQEIAAVGAEARRTLEALAGWRRRSGGRAPSAGRARSCRCACGALRTGSQNASGGTEQAGDFMTEVRAGPYLSAGHSGLEYTGALRAAWTGCGNYAPRSTPHSTGGWRWRACSGGSRPHRADRT